MKRQISQLQKWQLHVPFKSYNVHVVVKNQIQVKLNSFVSSYLIIDYE